MKQTLVWAYKSLSELDGKTGFVETDTETAAKLIKSGEVQDIHIGAHHFKPIEKGVANVVSAPKAQPQPKKAKGKAKYDTKVVTPKDKG